MITIDFQGGIYDPNNPLNMESLVLNTVHFLAGAACLCRPMMDQAIDQIDYTIEQVRRNFGVLRVANLDEFEMSIRQALLIMYNENDQWRIRALRIVMGKLIAVCFPLLVQSQRWVIYRKWWGVLRVRVVADHMWLYQAGMCQRSDVILAGFESLVVIWVRYRKEGWQPADDLMFPPHEVEDPPNPPASAPPTPAGGKKKSKAIPIIKPSDSYIYASAVKAPASSSRVNNQQIGDPSRSAGHSGAKPANGATADVSSPAFIHSIPTSEDPFITNASQPRPNLRPTFFTRSASKMTTSLPVSPQRTQGTHSLSRMADQPAPVLPYLPDGPFYFAETSIGEPANWVASCTAYSAPQSMVEGPYAINSSALSFSDESSCFTASATPSISEETSSASAASSSIDPLESPIRRLAELKIASDGPDDEIVEDLATPRASAFGQTQLSRGLFEHTPTGTPITHSSI